MTQSPIKRREYENVLSRRAVFSPGQSDDVAQNLAVAPRRDRQAMLEIPGRKTAFVGIITKFDLALFQRFAVGRADDRQQHAGPLAVRQDVPVDVERYRVWRGGPHSRTSSHHGLTARCTPTLMWRQSRRRPQS